MTLIMTGKTVKLFFYAVLVLIFVGWGYRGTKETSPLARHGVLDLSGWDLEKDGPVNLAGEWEFYWEQLLTPEDFHGPRPPEITWLSHASLGLERF